MGQTLLEGMAQVLMTACPVEKCRCLQILWQAWEGGTLPLGEKEVSLPDNPARPEKPPLAPVHQMPRRSMGPTGRLVMLHALAHIELNAVDLACDMVARFSLCFETSAERHAFAHEWLKVAFEEQGHFLMITKRLGEFGGAYGDYLAHDGLWQSAFQTRHDLEARLAVVPMVLEARGLDVTPHLQQQFERAGDEKTAHLLRIIYEDEIGHVATGVKWFEHVVRLPPTEQQQRFHELIKTYVRGGLKAPFNEAGRTQAGMAAGYYEGALQCRS